MRSIESILVVGLLEFVAREFLVVHFVPAIGDIGQHKGHQDAHNAHHRQRELAR